MLHYSIAEDAAVVAAHHKLTFKECWDVAGTLLFMVLSLCASVGLCSFIARF